MKQNLYTNLIFLERTVCNYADTLLTAMNTRVNLISGSVPDPHPCSLDPNTLRSVDEDDDYEAIINC